MLLSCRARPDLCPDLWPQPGVLLPLPSVPRRPAAEAGILHAVPGAVGKQAAVEPGGRSDWFPSAPGVGTDVRARSPNRFCPVPADLTSLCAELRSEGWPRRICDPSPALQRPMDGKTSPVRCGQLLQLCPGSEYRGLLGGHRDLLPSGFGGGPGFSLLLSGVLPSQQPVAAGGEKDPGRAACGTAASGTPSAHGGRGTAVSIPSVSPMPAEEASGTLAPLLFHARADLQAGGTGWRGRLALLVGAGAACTHGSCMVLSPLAPPTSTAGGPGPRCPPLPALLAVFPTLFSGWVAKGLLGLCHGTLLSILS